MPFHFEIDSERKLVQFKSGRSFTSQDLFDSLNKVVSHPSYRPGFDHLVDMTAVQKQEVGEIEVRIRANADQRIMNKVGESRFAIVSANEPVYQMTRQYKEAMSKSPITIEIFMDLDEAREWLGLDA